MNGEFMSILSYIYICGSGSTKLLNTDPDPQNWTEPDHFHPEPDPIWILSWNHTKINPFYSKVRIFSFLYFKIVTCIKNVYLNPRWYRKQETKLTKIALKLKTQVIKIGKSIFAEIEKKMLNKICFSRIVMVSDLP